MSPLPPIQIILGAVILAILLLSGRSRVARQANNVKEAGKAAKVSYFDSVAEKQAREALRAHEYSASPPSLFGEPPQQPPPPPPPPPGHHHHYSHLSEHAPGSGGYMLPTHAHEGAAPPPRNHGAFLHRHSGHGGHVAADVAAHPHFAPFSGAQLLHVPPPAAQAPSPPRAAPFEGAVESPPRAVPFAGTVDPPPSAAPLEGAADSPLSVMSLADAVEPPPRAAPFAGAASPPRTASFARAALFLGNAESPSPSVKQPFLRRRSGHAPMSAHKPLAHEATLRRALLDEEAARADEARREAAAGARVAAAAAAVAVATPAAVNEAAAAAAAARATEAPARHAAAMRSTPASAGAPPPPATPERLPLSDSVAALCVVDGALVSGGPGHLWVWGGGSGGGGGGGALHTALSGGRAVGLTALSGSRYFVAAGGRSLTVDVWDRHGRRAQLRGHDGNVTCVASLEGVPRGLPVFATGSSDATIRLWDLEAAERGGGAGTPTRAPASTAATAADRTYAPSLVPVLRGHKDAVAALAALRAPLLASGSFDKTAIVWDTKREVAVLSLQHPACVRALAALKGGSLLAAGCDDGVVYVWGVTAEGDAGAAGEARAAAAGKLAKERLARAKAAEDKAKASPADTALRAAAQFARAALAARADGVALLRGHKSWVISLAELPDGRLASGSNDGTVRLWDVDTEACACVLVHGGPVAALSVRPDGRLAAGTLVLGDKPPHKEALRLWNV